MTPSQLNIIYSNVFPKFERWITSNSGTADDAHDTFQEVLEMVLIKESRKELNIKSSLESYVFQACKFRWIDQLRKRKRNGEVISLDETLLNNRDGQDSIKDLEATKLKYTLMDKTFKELTELCQRLLDLVKKGKKPAEIVSILDMSNVNSVNRRKYACMESWKKKVQQLKSQYFNI